MPSDLDDEANEEMVLPFRIVGAELEHRDAVETLHSPAPNTRDKAAADIVLLQPLQHLSPVWTQAASNCREPSIDQAQVPSLLRLILLALSKSYYMVGCVGEATEALDSRTASIPLARQISETQQSTRHSTWQETSKRISSRLRSTQRKAHQS
ncbi:unnamed protein product [Tilletia laevis]|uniref:Uncharacterized protein n=3 Tax=Tilletia TaxID=13289 RepID=A0A8X7SVD8_9BASI|nr:hypothetical protein CF328_g5352 [Tilletia controversa]KAE8197057.1 hypothetical protein CF336_g2326 [Tilletia laevis]KAE8263101.1 hypothetical protein A4X03_0g1925 [Tilletia caries]KAE8206695.1 hypothetical protein CF335_g1694 [Tilletia laevis]KAE8245216.1 hypothetical protein A4X06_0g5778 [Tilletia controversa]